MMTLNESQQRAVMHKNGPMMVLAGPGSGKTAVIIRRAQYLIQSHGIPSRGILVIAYSKAAAGQMQKRFDALGMNASVVFGTFHSIFFTILRRSKGFTLSQVFKEHERRDTLKAILADMEYELEEEALSAIANELSMVKNELIDLQYYHSANMSRQDFVALFNQYEGYKNKHSKIDFDDMLTLCYRLLSQSPGILASWQRRYPYIMLDEFQDINRVQYEVIKMLAAPANNLFIVGDDDQSIYRFRGSRPEFLLNFPKDFPDTAQEVLHTNYRSTDAIIQFANTLISKNEIRFGKRITGTQKTGRAPVMLAAADTNHEAGQIAALIKEQLKKGADPDEIAVVYRLNIQSRAFGDAFLNDNIPFRVRDEAPSLYEHWIAQDIGAYLRLSQGHPRGYDPHAWRIINKPYRFISKAFLVAAKKDDVHILEAYSRHPTLHNAQKNRILELVYNLQDIKTKKPAKAIQYIRKTIGYDQHIIDHCEYRKTDPTGLFEIADEIQEAAKPFDNAVDFLNHMSETVQWLKQNRDLAMPAVTLTTMHSAKGLEFDTVYIAGAVDGVIPHERSKTHAEIEEERRLLYVAITRARHALYISTPKMKYEKSVKASRFLSK
jgi:DNA helicase-2/ATP-dependent DNA helicase PcrA